MSGRSRAAGRITIRHAAGLVFISLAVGIRAQVDSQKQPVLPEAPGVEETSASCLACHGADIIAEQRLSRRGWEKVVDKMIGWGAPVSPAERELIVSYLADHFGTRSGPDSRAKRELPAGEGAEKVEASCLACHGLDIIMEQRLDKKRWGRVVDKMIGWGAPVSPAEREAIIEYLSSNFPDEDL